MLICWAFRALESRFPVVSGTVVARTTNQGWGGPQADFTILIHPTGNQVHSRAPLFLLERVPEMVKLHYSGDPSRLVYLFEHEQNLLWIGVYCWAIGIAFAIVVAFRHGPLICLLIPCEWPLRKGHVSEVND